MAERVPLTGVRYIDSLGQVRHMVPLRDPSDGTWYVLDEDGLNVWEGADAIRVHADQLEAEVVAYDRATGGMTILEVVDTIAAYRILADLIEEDG